MLAGSHRSPRTGACTPPQLAVLPSCRLKQHAQPKGESLSSRPSAHVVPFLCQRRRSHPLIGGLTSVLRSIEPECDGWPPFTRIGKEELEGVPHGNNTPRREGCPGVRLVSAAKLDEGLALGDLRRCHRRAGKILPDPLGG